MADKFINLTDLGEIRSWILTKLGLKQDTLVSGTNIKTINNQSLVGGGNIDLQGNVFIATINQTTNAELVAARSAGKGLFIADPPYIYPACFGDTTQSGTIELVVGLGIARANYTIDTNDVWDVRYVIAQTLVDNPVNGDILITDADGQAQDSGTDLTTLLNDVEAGKEAFMLKDFNQQINLTIPSVTQDVANTSIPNMDVDLNEIDPTGALNTKYAIAGLVKYEIYDATSGGNRLNAFPVCSFSMNGQRTLRLRCMVGGPNSKTARRISGALLLKHR